MQQIVNYKELFKRIEDTIKLNAFEFPDEEILKCHYLDGTTKAITNGQLYKEAQECANYLKQQGCREGDRIGLLCENSIEWAIVFFAVQLCQATAVLLDPKLAPQQLTKQIQFAELHSLFVSEGLRENVDAEIQKHLLIQRIEQGWGKITQREWPLVGNLHDRDPEIALIIFTSGTLGTYKAVMIEHKSVIASFSFGPKLSKQKLLSILPWNHIYGLITNLLMCLARQYPIVIVQKLDWPTLSKVMNTDHPAIMPCVPRVLKLLHYQIMEKIRQKSSFQQKLIKKMMEMSCYFQEKWGIDISGMFFNAIHQAFGGKLRLFISGGASLSPDVMHDLKAFGFTVLEGYGLTETTAMVSSQTSSVNQIGSTGVLALGVEGQIIFPNSDGEGEICVKGDNIMRGYFHNHIDTEACLNNGWFRTGDRGHFDANGELFITGRVKELIVTATGKKVAPTEIEFLYASIERVKEIAVMGVSKGAGENDEIYAAVILDYAFKPIIENTVELQTLVKQAMIEHTNSLSAHLRIQHIFFVDDFPRTSTLKVKRKQLAEELLIKQKEQAAVASTPTSRSDEHEQILQELIQILKPLVPAISHINPHVHLSELGLDSLSALFLINTLNERYENRVTPQAIFTNPSVEGLAEYLYQQKHAPVKPIEEAVEEEKLNHPIEEAQVDEKAVRLSCQNIFLTGVTGILGSYLVRTLLADTQAEIYCLIRAKTNEQAFQRLRNFLMIYETEPALMEQLEKRVHPVLGDISADHFGLFDSDYNDLIAKVDVTIHAAAMTSLHGIYEVLKEVNVNGTQRVIDFALQTKQKYLAYISTYSVMGDRQLRTCDPFTEKDLNKGQGFRGLGYQQTKFEAEKSVHLAGERGLNWIILRPGDIFGDSVTGCYPLVGGSVQGVFYDIFKTVIETRYAANSAMYFDVAPVDYVARGIVHLVLKHQAIFDTYHLTNPSIHRYFEVVQILQNCGYEIELVSAERYIKALKGHQLKAFGKEYHSMTTELLLANPVHLLAPGSSYADSSYTKHVLESAGIVCPNIDEALLNIYMQYCERVGYIDAWQSHRIA